MTGKGSTPPSPPTERVSRGSPIAWLPSGAIWKWSHLPEVARSCVDQCRSGSDRRADQQKAVGPLEWESHLRPVLGKIPPMPVELNRANLSNTGEGWSGSHRLKSVQGLPRSTPRLGLYGHKQVLDLPLRDVIILGWIEPEWWTRSFAGSRARGPR